MRDYANIITAIWNDPGFLALPASAQRTYMVLITQADITAAGTLPLTERRWANYATDTTRTDIEADLKTLEAAEFAYTDEDTEEVLVRTFTKHDKGYNNPKRIPVILASAKAIRSLKLRRVLWTELARLGLGDDLPEIPETSTDSLSDSHTRFDRVVVTVVTTDPSTLKPQTELASLVPHAAPKTRVRPKPKRRIPEDFTVDQNMIDWARGHTPLVGKTETDAFIDHFRGSGVAKADWIATWRNWMRRAQNDAERNGARASPRAGPKPSTTDERVNAALALAAEFRTEAQKAIDP